MNTNSIIESSPLSVGAATWWAILPFLLIGGLCILIILAMPYIQDRVLRIKPVFLKLMTLVCIAGFGFSQTFFGSDAAYHYVAAVALFWLKYGFGLAGIIFTTMIGYFSTDYAKHQQDQKEAQAGVVTQVQSKTEITQTAKTGNPDSGIPSALVEKKD